MTAGREILERHPTALRVAPFVLFVMFTALQGRFGVESAFYLYGAKTLVGAGLLWLIWPLVGEMRWAWSARAVGVGIAVFVLWVGIDPWYPHLDASAVPWNPFKTFGEGSALAWGLVMLRWVGSTLVVPPLEEVFYRSWLYRYVESARFHELPLRFLGWRAFLVSSVVFGLAHNEWLAGILCGMAYQWLVVKRGDLGEAMTAHAVTNFLLGGWVLWRGAWNFW